MPQNADAMVASPVQPPAMHILLFVHIPKTGGSSLSFWVRSRLRVHHFSYRFSECFLCSSHHGHVFASLCKLFKTSICKRGRVWPLPPEASVFVEFHSNKVMQFWTTVAPRIEALRAVHEPNGGSVKIMTLLREPRAQIVSYYQMWPPTLPTQGTRGILRVRDTTLTPINTYLSNGNMRGLQTVWLFNETRGLNSTTRRKASKADAPECNADAAIRRLCVFDHVANISTVNITWMCEAMRTRTTRTSVPVHTAPKGNRVIVQGGENGILYGMVLNETRQVRKALTEGRSLQPCRGHICAIVTTAVQHAFRDDTSGPTFSQVDFNLLNIAAWCDDQLPWAEHWISDTAPRCADGGDNLVPTVSHPARNIMHSAQARDRVRGTRREQ